MINPITWSEEKSQFKVKTDLVFAEMLEYSAVENIRLLSLSLFFLGATIISSLFIFFIDSLDFKSRRLSDLIFVLTALDLDSGSISKHKFRSSRIPTVNST